MKIEVYETGRAKETQVTITCEAIDAQVLSILAHLRAYDKKITGTCGDQTYLLDAATILYIESVDKNTFLYTTTEIYQTPLRLYELEDRLAGCDFFRASKSTIINFNQIQSLRPEFGGKFLLTMQNGEKLYVSRQYVPVVKHKLGLI